MPLLRSLGNLFATARPQEVLPTMATDPMFMVLLVRTANSPRHGLQKEALWVLSNLIALQSDDRLWVQLQPSEKPSKEPDQVHIAKGRE